MVAPGNSKNTSTSVRQPVLLGLFTGTAVGAGYLLAGIPNIELMTLIIAVCGRVLGARSGLAAGVLAAVVYSLGSPFGLPVPLLLAAQALGLGSAGVLGAIGGNRVLSYHYKGKRLAALAWAAITGLGSTLIYDLLTNLAIIGAFELKPVVVLTGAVPFVLLHLGSNAVIFAVLLPLVLPRLVGLGRASLVGRSGPPVLLALLLLGVSAPSGAQIVTAGDGVADGASALADSNTAVMGASEVDSSLARPPVISGPAKAFGWQRPLWTPFARTALEWLGWNSRFAPVIDGGLGAPAVVLGEASTASNPLFVRDGIPVGTGHVLADDPWLVPTAGLVFSQVRDGRDGWGGQGGLVEMQTEDPDPGKAVSAYRGTKGKHESYYRSIHLLTPKAAWRAGFEFEESLDVESYDFAPSGGALAGGLGNPFPGHSRVRQSRTRLFRNLAPGDHLVVEYTNGRLTKDTLPAYGEEHLELWDDGLAATMQARLSSWQLQTSLFWRNRDVVWGARADAAVVGEDSRKLETGREGWRLDLHRADEPADVATGLLLQVSNWHVDDSLSDATWLADFRGSGAGRGQTARAMLRSGGAFAGATVRAEAGADWHSEAGLGPAAVLSWSGAGARPWWTLEASYGGRAPRSDELLTPLRRDVAGRELVLLPNPDLDREKTLRLGLLLQAHVLGFDLALDGSIRRLKDGITWRQEPGLPDVGRWRNALELASTRLTGRIGHAGRFLGWGRLMLEGTWQQSDERAGQAALLPPEQYLRSHLMWENHFFQEDGILQLALLSTWQGEMADPWDVTRAAQLPARTVHDLFLGFRLVGAHLSLGVRNLTGERTLLTSGALSTGQETEMRLHWAWVY